MVYEKVKPTYYNQDEPLNIYVIKYSTSVKYVAEAAPGTAVTAKLWRIKKVELSTITIDGVVYNLEPKVTWASGTEFFDKYLNLDASNNALKYTYS